jgi:predicted MPP superfamily phosphohydrolase
MLSDLHMVSRNDFEIKISDALKSIQPDIILLVGDYVAWNGDYEIAIDFLSSLKAKVGIFGVMGDYDYSNSRKSCLFCHEKGGRWPTSRHKVRFLRDSCESLMITSSPFQICGLDGSKLDEPLSAYISKIRKVARNNDPVIVVSHSPLVFDYFNKDDDVLILAGDTHGGQIPLPSGLWRILGYEKNAKYEQGWFEEGKKKMYVSRGVGVSHFPIRFMRPPEITVLHFVSTEVH